MQLMRCSSSLIGSSFYAVHHRSMPVTKVPGAPSMLHGHGKRATEELLDSSRKRDGMIYLRD
jgi:hypothetical protein